MGLEEAEVRTATQGRLFSYQMVEALGLLGRYPVTRALSFARPLATPLPAQIQ